jgi:type IV pilus assembly protein PilC
MLFNYQALDQTGATKNGSIDAVNVDIAIASLQRRGFVITSINAADGKGSGLNINLSFLDRVSNKDVVILSRQLATLFSAQVSALRIFRLLSEESENKALGQTACPDF